MRISTNVNDGTNLVRPARGLVRAFLFIGLVMAVAVGCSRTNEPEAQGTINVKFYFDEAAGDIAFSPAQVTLDSVVVLVFRGGAGVTHETARGAAINGASQVDLTITCIAETWNDIPLIVQFFIN